MGRRRPRTVAVLTVAVLAALLGGCSFEVDAPASIADQVAAAQAERGDPPTEDQPTEEPATETATPDATEEPAPEPDPEPEAPTAEVAAIDAACVELLATFGGEPLGPEDEGFVDRARTWRQRSVTLAEATAAAAAQDPAYTALAEATGDGAGIMRTLHLAAQEEDGETVLEQLAAYDEVGAVIEAEAVALGITGCFQEPEPTEG